MKPVAAASAVAAAATAMPTVSASGKPLSPLELARIQGAAGSKKSETPTAAPVVAAPAPVVKAVPAAAPVAPAPKPVAVAIPTTGPDGRPLSPLELARLQGAFKGGK